MHGQDCDNDTRAMRPTRRELFVGGSSVLALSALLTGCERRRVPARRGEGDEADAPIPEALVRYREATTLAASVPSPQGLAVAPDDGIWVVGRDGAALLGETAGARSGAAVRFQGQGSCIAVWGERLLIGVGGTVLQASAKGGDAVPWLDAGEKAVITCIAGVTDVVYMADAGNRRIIRCRPDGSVAGYLCEKDPDRGYSGLIVPSPHLDVAVAEDGSVHVANPGAHRIEVYDPDGSPRWSWGETSQGVEGFCGCCNPTDFAILPDGRYVTAEKGIPRVKVYDAQGHFECVVAGPQHLSPGVVGLDVAARKDSSILVLDPGAALVRVFVQKEGA